MAPPADRAGFVPNSAAIKPVSLSSSARTVSPALATTVTPPRQHAPAAAPGLATQLAPQRQPNFYHSDASFGKGTGKVVVLFRSDLRLDDNPALSHAVEDAASVVPVYCFDPRHFGRTQHGFEKTGKYRARFLLESVADLRRSLQAKGSDLVVRVGKPEQVVPQLCRKLNARAVFLHREVVYEDQQVEAKLEKTLKEKNVEIKFFWSNTLYHDDDLPFDLQSMPDVYSDFREQVEKRGTIRTPLPIPESIPKMPAGVSAGEIPTLSALGIDDSPSRIPHSPTGVSSVTGGETEAKLRVANYVKESGRSSAENTPRSRVTAHLGADFSCRISPWLALGCISPRRIFDEMKKTTTGPQGLTRSSTYFELVWRDFFRCITFKYSCMRDSTKKGVSTRQRALARS